MDRIALHLEIRNALELADELSRYEHASGNDDLTAHLVALRSALDVLEREAGRSHAVSLPFDRAATTALQTSRATLLARRNELPEAVHHRVGQLLASTERVAFGLDHPHELARSKPLLGVLPLARIVPQDVHSVMDYLAAAASLAGGLLARSPAARRVGIVMAASDAGTSMMTDYRLSAVKLIPIEAHEAIDYLWGASLAAAPFVLGYGYTKRDRLSTILHVAAGLGTIVASLFTDYRAARGVTWPIRSKGGPARRARIATGPARARVHEAQRPLEGLSSAPTDWQPDTQWPSR